MTSLLPLEVIDLILALSFQISSPTSFAPSQSREIDSLLQHISQAANACRLSRHHYQTFTKHLYRHVILVRPESILQFCRTISEQATLAGHVRHLAILNRLDFGPQVVSRSTLAQGQLDEHPEGLTVDTADAILQACPNATHLLLPRSLFSDWSAALYRLVSPKEITLIDVTRSSDLDGLVTRHRELMTRALENDPRIQAVLRPSTSTSVAAASSSSPSDRSTPTVPTSRSELKPLSRLHLVNFDGRLLHHLALLSSLTHVVLTYPLAPELPPGAPGLAIIPRSHLLLLLRTGNIARIVIRADIQTCLRMMEELMPIDDNKLIFRPIRTGADPLFTSARPGPSSSNRSRWNEVQQLDVLSEFMDRLRLDLDRSARSRSSDRSGASWSDADTSRESAGTSSLEESSRSSESDSRGFDDDDDDNGSDDDHLEDVGGDHHHDNNEPRTAGGQAGTHSATLPPRSAVAGGGGMPSRDAPPLQIPIEELLRHESFRPPGLAPLASTTQQQSEPRSSDSNSAPTSGSSDSRRHALRLRRGPYVTRRTDFRGATQVSVDRCARLYDFLAAGAGVEQEMQFW